MVSVVIDQTPRDIQLAPFASESGLQQFVEDNADLLDIKVLASSRRGGNGLCKIDILGADKRGRLWIIECKHDLVNATALRQLRTYRGALISAWPAAAPILRARHNLTLADTPDPVLALIGYRFDEGFADDQVVRIVYRYHGLQFTDDELQIQRPGRVSLHMAAGHPGPEQGHPKVSKKIATTERLQRFAPSLTEAFWRVDAELQELGGVTVKYGGKNFVRYSTRAGIFAEAVIRDGSIEWRVTVSRMMRSDSDTARLLTLLRETCGRPLLPPVDR